LTKHTAKAILKITDKIETSYLDKLLRGNLADEATELILKYQ